MHWWAHQAVRRKAEESLICLGTSLALAVLEVRSLDVSKLFYFTVTSI